MSPTNYIVHLGNHSSVYQHFIFLPNSNSRAVDRCIDYLRQSILCKADTTPVTFLYSNITRSVLPDFETIHTFTNFEKIRAWGYRRTSGKDVEQIVEDWLRYTVLPVLPTNTNDISLQRPNYLSWAIS